MSGGITSGGRTVTAAELMAGARRAAGGFAGLGIGAGDSVALILRNDIAAFEANQAAFMLGAFPVPVNWHYTGEEARYVIEDSGARAVVIHADLLARLGPDLPAGVPVLVVETPSEIAAAYGIDAALCGVPGGATGWTDWLQNQQPWAGEPAADRSSMIYTSGTTGRPKGVRRGAPVGEAAQAAIAKLYRDVLGIKPGVRAAITGPIYHSAPAAVSSRALAVGGSLVLQPRFDAEDLLRLIEAHRITTMHMVPTMFVRLLRLPAAVRGKYDLSSLEWLIHGAAH